jgi:hypothetical protein
MSGVRVSDGNWQQSDTYNYADDLVRADWAWEALRRNPQFRKSWHDAQRHFEIIEHRDHLRVIGCFTDSRTLQRWGCLYTDPPDHNAAHATVIWQPQHFARMSPTEAPHKNLGLKRPYSISMT